MRALQHCRLPPLAGLVRQPTGAAAQLRPGLQARLTQRPVHEEPQTCGLAAKHVPMTDPEHAGSLAPSAVSAGQRARGARHSMAGKSGRRPACASAKPAESAGSTSRSSGSRWMVVRCCPAGSGRQRKRGSPVSAMLTCAAPHPRVGLESGQGRGSGSGSAAAPSAPC